MKTLIPVDRRNNLVLHLDPEVLTSVQGGFGYMGVLLETEDGRLMQCHLCGKLFAVLSAHIKHGHGIQPKNYKERFGLAMSTALSSTKVREKMRRKYDEYISSLTPKQREEFWGRGHLILKKWHKVKRDMSHPHSLQDRLERGRTSAQIIDKIRQAASHFGHTPSQRDFIYFCGGTQKYKHQAFSHFGGWRQAVIAAGLIPLPYKHHKGPRQKYTDDQMLKYIADFARERGKAPASYEFNTREIPPTYDTYIRRFGSIDKAREKAQVWRWARKPRYKNEYLKKNFYTERG